MKFKSFWIILLLNIFAFQLATAQLAIIKDKDGYTNVRELPTSKSKVIDKVYDFEVFWAYDGNGDLKFEVPKNWKHIIYGFELTKEIDFDIKLGFMHESRVQYLSDFEKLNTTIIGKKAVKLSNDSNSMQVKIEKEEFDESKHKVEYKGDLHILHIDGRAIWGSLDTPDNAITSIKTTVQGKTVNIPKSAFSDLYEPNFYTTEVYIDTATNTQYIQMLNSSGGIRYYVVWVIHNGEYHSRFVGEPY